MEFYYIWFVLFAFAAYYVVTDENVAKFVYLIYKNAEIQYHKMIWWIKYNPRNPIVRYLMERKSMKLAEELMKEFEKENE